MKALEVEVELKAMQGSYPAAFWGVDQEQSIESSDAALTLVVQNVAKQWATTI